MNTSIYMDYVPITKLIRLLYYLPMEMNKEEYYKILKEQNEMFSECIRYLIRVGIIGLSLIVIAYAVW